MSLKMKVATPAIFTLVMITASFLILSSTSTQAQAAVPNELVKQLEQVEDPQQEQSIVRPKLILNVSIAPEPIVGEIVTLGFAATLQLIDRNLLASFLQKRIIGALNRAGGKNK
ncbi:hypothetical protein MNBD_CHLOROFLEXI01-1174 [hydrothermal vent metagenome]|uniref:Uncharacterized protein n=1 Tax=hydrothermal vent metagenome TaxID=652676 RepID=A0A3B0VQA3_9ZZZZ